jgi:ubiquinone/menaquinone biosynthesis C-methylase UbiE
MSSVPIPPVEFQTLVCGPGGEPLFEEVGCWLRDALYHQGMLQPNANLLDVGCGCGRLARALLDSPIGSYTGFDRHKGMVDWCLQEISSRDPRFRFDYFDLKSVYTVLDDQVGLIDAETFRFPYADAAFDAVIIASVFTHMLPVQTRHYLGELARMMQPGAKALVSIFLSPTGSTEVRDDGTNVFHNSAAFLADVAVLPFDLRLTGLRFVSGITAARSVQSNPTPVQSFDYEHNWYVLTRLISGS